jgi:hypothetical protein
VNALTVFFESKNFENFTAECLEYKIYMYIRYDYVVLRHIQIEREER